MRMEREEKIQKKSKRTIDEEHAVSVKYLHAELRKELPSEVAEKRLVIYMFHS